MSSFISITMILWTQLSIIPVELYHVKEPTGMLTCPVAAPRANQPLAFAHRTCTKFYTCRRGRRLVRQCPIGLFYHDRLGVCDYPTNVECGGRAALRDNDDENHKKFVIDISVHQADNNNNEHSTNDDCDTCTDSGQVTHRPTLPDDGIVIVVTERTSERTTVRNTLPDDGLVVVYKKKHDQFYHHSPLWYLYNRYPKRRSLIHDVLSLKKLEDNLLPNGCPRDYSVHWLTEHPASCTKFYYCQLGNRVLRTCSKGLYFNPIAQMCDWPKHVYCNKN